MKLEKLETIVTRLDQAAMPFVVFYYDVAQSATIRLLVFGANITEVTNIAENYLADLSVDAVVTSVELFGVYATLYGIKPAVHSTTDELDDPIRR